MHKITNKWTCSCGCGQWSDSGHGWLALRMVAPFLSDDRAKVEDVHFQSVQCLQKWCEMYRKIVPELELEANRLRPRGTFKSEKIEGVYV